MSSLRHDDIHQTPAPERNGGGWKSGLKRAKREWGTKGRFDRGDVPRTKAPDGASRFYNFDFELGRETLQIVLVLSARYVVSEVAWGKDDLRKDFRASVDKASDAVGWTPRKTSAKTHINPTETRWGHGTPKEGESHPRPKRDPQPVEPMLLRNARTGSKETGDSEAIAAEVDAVETSSKANCPT
ncbi:hypothetical protein BJV77DRAFT_963333 [Russula vinacea]|nr:hypothetical protein BJV77DRAFT_963333 [Russula vinacea]